METQEKQAQSLDSTSSQDTIALPATDNNLPKLPPAAQSDTQWQRISKQITDFLDQLPQYLGNFFDQYKQPLITLGLIFAAIITVKVVLALLDAINDIPLLEPIFELIGISYGTWFVFRYLIKASTRQELAQDIRLLRSQILGE